MIKKLLLIFVLYAIHFQSYAQDFSNKGKDFWVGYGNHVRMFNAGAPETMQIYLTSDVTTTGTVAIGSIGFSQTFTVFANQITVVNIPRTAALLDEGLYNHGIHITALKPIVAYGFIYVNAISGATVFLPTNTLGKEYFSLNYTQVSNEPNSYSYFFVEAVEPGSTIIEIKPSQTTKGGWLANVVQTITLTQGQIYQVLSTTDLTGSTIKSIASGTGGCKKIAVFCGSGKISIGCPTPGSSDNLYQQMYPASTWGKKYVLIPSFNRAAITPLTNPPNFQAPVIRTNFFRIYRPDVTTIVSLNGAVIPPASFTNNYFQFSSNLTNLVEADKSILVAQYYSTAGCSGTPNPHDPEMVYLNPVEQTVTDVTVNSMQPAANTAIYQHFINVVVKSAGTGISSFQIDGITPPASIFTTLPQDPNFSYARIWNNGGATTLVGPSLFSGAHRLTCDSGFNAIAYGFGPAESYGYSAGTNLKDLFQQISVQSQFGIESSPSVCTNSPFRFRVSLPYCADSIQWNLSGLPGPPTPSNPKIIYSSCVPGLGGPDTTTVVNGKTLYWYFLPQLYTFPTAGLFPVIITSYNTGSTQCGSSQDIEFELGVFDPPIAGFTNNQPGCPSEPVQFTDTTQTIKPNYRWAWNFGDPGSGALNTSTQQDPIHIFTTSGPHTVTLTTTTTVGCFSTTANKIINVPALIDATINGTTTVCQNAPPPNITFTLTGGLPPYKINYTLSTNGGAPVVQTPIVSATLINTLSISTSTAGVYAYNITGVENANAAFCSRVITGQTATVTVNPLPSATIVGGMSVCQNAASPTLTLTGSGGTAPYTFNFTLNGSPQSITSTGNVAIINAPTTIAGTFTYVINSVSDASATNCLFTYIANNPTAVVIVQQQPSAVITGTSSVCQTATAPQVTFTGTNGAAPYLFTYNINGGGAQTISTSATSNSVNLIVPMITTGTFVYNLTSVQASGALNCANAVVGAFVTVVINPVPTATITGSTTVCQNTGAQNITFTGVGGTAPYTFAYNINGGATQTVTTTSGSSVTVAALSTLVGSFTYSLLSVTDATSTLCSQTYTTGNTATIVIQATPSATISGNTTVCQNSTAPIITFTGTNGNAPFTFTYNVNGGATQTISSAATSNTATLSVPMTASGTFVYNLLSVKNTGPVLCLTPITGASATVVLNPVPAATIIGTTTVCQNSTSPLITFTGANAMTPYTFTYVINGGAPQTISTTTGNSVTIAAPTGTQGVFVYTLTLVKDASSTQCIQTYTNTTATVTVRQLASATITGTTSVCQSTTSPNVTFTANGGVAPYTFSYTLNGTPQTVTTLFGNSVAVPVATTTPGTYTYVLQSVQESSSASCTQIQSGTVVVTIKPKPTASFVTPGPFFCQSNNIIINPSFGITPTGSVVSWIWDYGDGVGPQTRPNGNPFTLNYPTAGIKIVTFKTVSDLGCESNLFTDNIIVNSKPLAGFINPGACLADAQAQFTDTSTVAGAGASVVYWEWDFGDGSPVYAGSTLAHKNPLHTYAAVGQKSVQLKVTTNSGCKDTTVQQFFINGEVTRAAFNTLNANNLCSNRPVQIQENSIVNVGGLIRTDIYWDYVNAPTAFDQDNSPTPGKIYTHSYPNLQTDRTYSIKYFAYSGFNGVCQKDTIINIIVRASPVAQFIAVPDVCLNGGPITLTQGSASGGTGIYMGPGVTFSGGVYTFNPLATGVTVGTNNGVIYTVTSPAGCDSAKVQQIKVLAPPVVNTFITIGNLCRNNAITFRNTYTNGDGTIVKWIYNWNDGSPIQTLTTGADVTHVYAIAGPQTATLTLETGYGCRNIPVAVNFTVNPLPVPNYTFSNSVCLPAANIVFTNTTPNTAAHSYQWSFELPSTSPANTSSLINPSHIYTSQGPFNTHLIATHNTTGCKDSTAIIVINSNTIHPAPVLQFNPIPDVCLNNGLVNFAALGTETSGIAGGPGVFSGPGIVSASGDFNPLIAGVGTHTITYTWTSSFGCPTSTTKNVNVLVAPVADFSTVGNTCQNNAIIFHQTSTATVGTISQWIYDWGDGTPVQTFTNGNDQTHIYTTSPSTAFVATLTVITNGGCRSTPKQINVSVNPQPLPDFTFSPTACLPQARIDFVNITPPILSDWAYKWYFVQTPTSSLDSSVQTMPSHIYTTVGPHAVTLVATSPTTGCTNLRVIQVNTIHKAPVASFNFDKPSICVAQSVIVLQNSTAEEGTLTNWNWNYGDNSTAAGQAPAAHTYTAMGTYTVKLTATNSFGCTDDTTKPFIVYPYPVVNAGPDDVVLEGGTFNMAATATGNSLTYLWTSTPSPTYLSSNTILNPSAKPIVDITYKLAVTAQGGCTKADSVFIKVLKFPEIPNTFTPNNDGIHDFWEIKYLFTYPGNRVQVFTRTGQLVFESKGYAKPWDGNMNGKSLPFDTYYYIIEPGTGRKPVTGYVTIVK